MAGKSHTDAQDETSSAPPSQDADAKIPVTPEPPRSPGNLVRRAMQAPGSLNASDSRRLQQSVGNQATGRISMARRASPGTVQRQGGRGQRGQEEGREEGRETRTERAQDDDERRGRPAGGSRRGRRSEGSDFDSDWAGRAILERYLAGEGDWYISNSPRWTEYMKASDKLRQQLRPKIVEQARALARLGVDTRFPVAMSFPAELENGEGIIGYQYLHGTNQDVGGFQIIGVADVSHDYGECVQGESVCRIPGATVTMHVQFLWNDIIDPNPKYGTDIVKAIIAEIISFGEAEAYTISIAWTEDATVFVPEIGPPTIYGYPEQ